MGSEGAIFSNAKPFPTPLIKRTLQNYGAPRFRACDAQLLDSHSRRSLRFYGFTAPSKKERKEMNVTEGTSGTGAKAGQEQQKTFQEYLQEAQKLYEKCKAPIETCIKSYSKFSKDDFQIKENDNGLAIVTKMNAMDKLDKQFQDAMNIFEAKENIKRALEIKNLKGAKQLESSIDASFEKATSPTFQYYKSMTAWQKAQLIDSLWKRHEAVMQALGNTSDPKNTQLEDRLRKQKALFPPPYKCFYEVVKETINYEKQFSSDSSTDVAKFRDTLAQRRRTGETEAAAWSTKDVRKTGGEINENPHAVPIPLLPMGRQSAAALPNEAIDQCIELFDNSARYLRAAVEHDELLLDPDTPPTYKPGAEGESKERLFERLVKGRHEAVLGNFISNQALGAFWQLTKLVKHIDALKEDHGIKRNVARINEAAHQLVSQIIAIDPAGTVMRIQELAAIAKIAKTCAVVTCECDRLTGGLPKRHSAMLMKLGETLSEVEEGIVKILKLKDALTLVPESESEEFIAQLFGAQDEVAEESWIDDEARAEEGPSHKAPEEVSKVEAANLGDSGDTSERGEEKKEKSDAAEREVGSSPPPLDEGTPTETARPAEEADSEKIEEARRRKAIDEETRKLQKIERKLEQWIEEVQRIKQAFNEGGSIRYLAWDLENAPKTAVKYACIAQEKTSRIAAGLTSLAELPGVKGGASEAAYEKELSQHQGKADKYEALRKQYESESKALQIAAKKASLAIESVRKSNAAKRLLTELVELEKDPESFNVTACKVLPHCPPAKNRFGILEMKEGRQLYDHVLAFRVELENAPEFLVHFHFRHPLKTGKSPEHYVEKMEVHDWNVQAPNKQETEVKVRSRQPEEGQKVLAALHVAWKKKLEINRGKKTEIPVSSSVAPVRAGDQKKGKGRRR
jgi:hypothetical protein